MRAPTRLPVRLILAAEAAEFRLRTRFPPAIDALTPQRHRSAELDQIETDPAFRALFLAELDAALTERAAAEVAELEAFTDAVEAAAENLRAVILPGGERDA
ncbi:hypothetical protein [Streptomyces sp. C10-9-1]|uniref:hypothetical protein n=1 Tax=Streptomyces sp. C10-9-1 TaxID=1859285 RepID=UPI003D736C6D